MHEAQSTEKTLSSVHIKKCWRSTKKYVFDFIHTLKALLEAGDLHT